MDDAKRGKYMTPEEATRHAHPTLPDDDAEPPMERWVAACWIGLGAVGALAFATIVAMAVKRVWE